MEKFDYPQHIIIDLSRGDYLSPVYPTKPILKPSSTLLKNLEAQDVKKLRANIFLWDPFLP